MMYYASIARSSRLILPNREKYLPKAAARAAPELERSQTMRREA
jgi:hypothetical protein